MEDGLFHWTFVGIAGGDLNVPKSRHRRCERFAV
jgi:hypothetical protein